MKYIKLSVMSYINPSSPSLRKTVESQQLGLWCRKLRLKALPLYHHNLTQSYNQVVAVAHSNLPKALTPCLDFCFFKDCITFSVWWTHGFASIARILKLASHTSLSPTSLASKCPQQCICSNARINPSSPSLVDLYPHQISRWGIKICHNHAFFENLQQVNCYCAL
jgi:hypothetical protein